MGVAIDRTARGVVIFHGIAGAFIGAAPAAIVCMIVEKPFGNAWFRDALLYGSLAGGFIGAVSAMAGMLHEDLRTLRRQRQNTLNEPHMEKALLPAPPRGGSAAASDFQAMPLRSASESDHALAALGAEASGR